MIASSCTSNLVEIDESLDSSIEFGSYIDKESRALDKSYFANGDKFIVNAFLSDNSTVGQPFEANFMVNEELTKTSAGWSYSNTKFWPKNDTNRISFVASCPASVKPTIADGAIKYDFIVNANSALQEDFIWSTITDAWSGDRNGTHQNGVTEASNTPDQNVTFHFKHALSKIVFMAKTAENYTATNVTITDITVDNLYGRGEFLMNDNLNGFTSTPTGNQNVSYSVLTGGTEKAVNNETKSFGQSLLVVPQTLSDATDKETTVSIKYTINYGNPNKTVNEQRTFRLKTDAISIFEPDKVYNYTFNIALDMITFDARIDNWGTPSNNETFSVN